MNFEKMNITQTNKPPKKPKSISATAWMMGLVCIGVILFLLDIALGSVHIPLDEVVNIVLGAGTENEAWEKIVTLIRIPKAMTAVLAGCALSVAGLQMQTLFRNPLAGPSVLGITAGASLGVAVVMLSSGVATSMYTIKGLGLSGSWLLVLAATLGSVLILLLILAVSTRIRDNVVLLIVGIMVGNITISLVSIWQYYSNPQQIQDYLLWTFGSLGGVSSQHLIVMCVVVGLGILLTFAASKALNALLLGENYAQSLGTHVQQARVLIIVATALLAGSITAFCGPIGFVGIAVPHLARSVFHTSDHRVLIPAVCLMGAALMLGCDILAQLPGSQETLPINAVTALVGSPVVIWVIVQRNNLKLSF
jgi:iron complex transport system permease protein